jgi:Winged helix DNA-binding domain
MRFENVPTAGPRYVTSRMGRRIVCAAAPAPAVRIVGRHWRAGWPILQDSREMTSVTWDQVRARRLERSSLLSRAGAERLVGVAGDVGGVHAQVQASAELQLGARVAGVTQPDVRTALWEKRTLVKAWTLRGTLHLHPACELAVWRAARRACAGRGAGPEQLEEWRDPAGVVHPPIGGEQVREIRRAVWDALDGRCLSREDLAADVVGRVGPGPGQRLRSGFAFFLTDLCQGPPRGSRVTFVRPDQWIDDWREADPGESLRAVCRRFLSTYGPARPEDFREWIGGRALGAEAWHEAFRSLADELEEVDVEGRRAHVLAGDTAFADAPAPVRLLPEYDVYVMGFRERTHLVPEPVRQQVARHPKGRYEGPAGVRFLLAGGRLAGCWERRRRGRRIEVEVRPIRKLTRAERAEAAGETERIGALLGLQPALSIA